MKILVLSDSHTLTLDNLKLDINNYDYIIHAGDYGNSYDFLIKNNIIFVKGNCDNLGDKEKNFFIDDKKILLTHGDLYNVKYNLLNICYKARNSNVDICIFGHTHQINYFYYENILFLNPGSFKNNDYIKIINDTIYFYKDNKVIDEITYEWK